MLWSYVFEYLRLQRTNVISLKINITFEKKYNISKIFYFEVLSPHIISFYRLFQTTSWHQHIKRLYAQFVTKNFKLNMASDNT